MLGWIGLGGGADHPMADLREAKKLLAELPQKDGVKALDEITSWLNSLAHAQKVKLDSRVAATQLLDETAQSHQRKITREYVTAGRPQKIRETLLRNTQLEFWRHLVVAYEACLQQIEGGAKGDVLKAGLPLLVTRATRALANQLKWQLIHYGPPVPQIWANVAAFWQFAQQRGVTKATVTIYPNVPGESNMEQELARACMMAAAAPDKLLPLEIELVDRVNALFADRLVVAAHPDRNAAICLDLAAHKPPCRISKGVQTSSAKLYFGPGDVLEDVHRLIDHARHNNLPDALGLGGHFRAQTVQLVLQHLALFWSVEPPSRQHPRRKVMARFNVLPGIPALLRMLADQPAPEPSSSLDFAYSSGTAEELELFDTHAAAVRSPAESEVESWIVEDVSQTGVGAIVRQVRGDWLSIGALIGIKPENAQEWGVGIVRRLHRDTQRNLHVGVQTLSAQVGMAELHLEGRASNLRNSVEQAILLSTAELDGDKARMMLRSGVFNKDMTARTQIKNREWLLLPEQIIESSDQFDIVRFNCLAAEH